MSNEVLTKESFEEWKLKLRELFKKSFFGEATSGDLEFVGYAFQCLAPSHIFKYYSGSENHLNAIKDDKMWFSAPTKFNDVFDVDFSFDNKAVFLSIMEQQPGGREIRTGSQAWRALQKITTKALKEFESKMTQIRQQIGVSCFSESDDSLLMWAHYAHNHKGFCAEYELYEFSKQLSFTPVPVIYTNFKPCLKSLNLKEPQKDALSFFLDSITTKSTEWKYEKEWRIIRDDGACGSLWDIANSGALLPSITPSSIILGCEASHELEDVLFSFCKSKAISFYRMEKENTAYKLVKKPILLFD